MSQAPDATSENTATIHGKRIVVWRCKQIEGAWEVQMLGDQGDQAQPKQQVGTEVLAALTATQTHPYLNKWRKLLPIRAPDKD